MNSDTPLQLEAGAQERSPEVLSAEGPYEDHTVDISRRSKLSLNLEQEMALNFFFFF